jgi:hypothetical protein
MMTPPPGMIEWLLCAGCVMGLILLGLKIVDRVKGPAAHPPSGELGLRVSKLEEELKSLDQKMIDGFASLSDAITQRNREGEDRASKIHSRIDPIAQNTGEIKGQLHAFTESFRQFTEIMTAIARKQQ